MDPISNVDGLVLLLRQRLDERARTGATSREEGQRRTGGQTPDGLSSVQALAAIDGVDERQLRRALVQSLLTDQFGAAMINDAKFQRVVDQVTDSIASDQASTQLMERALVALKASVR